MALQILNPQRSFGEELGTSLAGGLNRLLENKLQQLHFSDALKQNNYSDAQIALLNQFPANQRLEVLQSLTPAGRRETTQQPLQQQMTPPVVAKLSERLQELQKQPEQLTQKELMSEFNQNKLEQMGLAQQQGPSADVQTLLNEATRQGLNLTNDQKQKIGRKVQEIYADQGKRKALEQDVMNFLNQQQAQQQQVQQKVPALQEPLLSQSPFKKPLTTSERIAQQRAELAEKKEARQEKLEAFKLTKGERKEVNDRVKLAKQNLHELNRLDELENENLESAGYYEFLNRSGLDIPSLMNPSSEEYDKISRGFIRNGKAIFGARITDNDLNLLLKLIPTLSMSPEGRKRVRSDMKYLARADEAYGQAMREIIKENKGIPPFDLTEQIDERVGPKLDQIAKKFKEDLRKPVKPSQDKLITALQAGLGNLSGSLPGILKGAARGALGGAAIGSVVPGIGTGAGALGGAAFGALGGSAKDII